MVRVIQIPYNSSKVVWRHKGPNITSLLTNTLIPCDRNYLSSHLCYNVYSSRIINNEKESCIRACNGEDLGISGPVVIQRYNSNSNGIEVLRLVRSGENKDIIASKDNSYIEYCFDRVLVLEDVTENEIKDIKLQTSSDYYQDNDNGVCVYIRTLNELVVIRLSKTETNDTGSEGNLLPDGKSIKYDFLFKSGVEDIIKSMQNEHLIDNIKTSSETSIYGIVASSYNYMEISLLLSNRVMIRMSLNTGNEFKELYCLNDHYKFEQEVLQCFSYGYNSNTYIIGGKCIYLFELGTQLNLTRIYPNRDETCDKKSEDNTLKAMISYTGRLMRLQTLKNRNTSYVNVTGLAIHPVYSNILAFIESRSSKVIVINIYQDSTTPLCEFSIPFTESLGNSTCRFRHIDWVFPRIKSTSENKDTVEMESGIVLYCSSYPVMIYSLLTIRYSEDEVDEHFKASVELVKELWMSKWDLEQDRRCYFPKKTQLLESSIDYLDNIMDNYSIDDNFLSQYFHGYSGVTALFVDYNVMESSDFFNSEDKPAIFSQSTSKHKLVGHDISLRDMESLMFFALNNCGRVTQVTLDLVRNENIDETEEKELTEYFNREIKGVYHCRELKTCLIDLYATAKYLNSSLTHKSLGGFRCVTRAVVNYPRGGEALNNELEVSNEQLTKRKYYNSKVYSGFDLISWLLEDKKDTSEDVNNSSTEMNDGRSKLLLPLPLPITNGFDYSKEFQTKPKVLWSDDSILLGEATGENDLVHIPSLVTQPFPLCSCRYFELPSTEERDGDGELNRTSDSAHIDVFNHKIKRPVFDIIGSKEFEYNHSLEEYLSYIPKHGVRDNRKLQSECFSESECNAEESVGCLNRQDKKLVLSKYLLNGISDHIFCLPLLPVSREMANNYLSNRHYIGGMVSDHIKNRKWRISESCSRMKQPGCLLKHIVDVENNIRSISESEEEFYKRLFDDGSDDSSRRDFPISHEKINSDGDINDNKSRESSQEDDELLHSDVEYKDKLPKRGICVDKELIRSLIRYWDESCDYYGIKEDHTDNGSKGDHEKDTDGYIDLLKDDLSQWHSYPYISFETIDSSISDKEQLKLSLMSYVDTQLSNM